MMDGTMKQSIQLQYWGTSEVETPNINDINDNWSLNRVNICVVCFHFFPLPCVFNTL